MNEEYQQKINGYKEDIQQNIDQEAVLQTIKNCKKTFVQAEDYPLSYMEFYMIRCSLFRNDGGSCKGVC